MLLFCWLKIKINFFVQMLEAYFFRRAQCRNWNGGIWVFFNCGEYNMLVCQHIEQCGLSRWSSQEVTNVSVHRSPCSLFTLWVYGSTGWATSSICFCSLCLHFHSVDQDQVSGKHSTVTLCITHSLLSFSCLPDTV